MKIIGKEIIDEVNAEARRSPRLRMNRNIHETLDEPVHKMLNSLQPGTVMPVHRHLHPAKKETFVLLQGSLELRRYADDGSVLERHTLSRATGNVVCEIMPADWHSFTVLEPDTVILEVKQGPYVPLPPEDVLQVPPREGGAS
jgi:cupin fold WbuC family metalloprotein